MGLFGFDKFQPLKDHFDIENQVLRKRISDLELEIEKFKSQLISLRGLVNRKLGDIEGVPEKERTKSVDGLDDLR